MSLADINLNNVLDYFAGVFGGDHLYIELSIVAICILIGYFFSKYVRSHVQLFHSPSEGANRPLLALAYRLGKLIYPLVTLTLIKIMSVSFFEASYASPLLIFATSVLSLIMLFVTIDELVKSTVPKRILLMVCVPILLLNLIGVWPEIVKILDSVTFEIGSIKISIYSALRLILVGSLVLWLGGVASRTGKKVIKNQTGLDLRTREVFSKMFEILVFFAIFILLLNVIGVNLTTLAVFGGAIGVGLGFGLQSIASNFISGVIILLDRSVSIDDYIELEDGRTGRVTEMSLRSTTLETYDGKDIVVPNEKFISSSFTNWTHKDGKQRYRVDFSVAYHSDIRKLVDFIKEAVSNHPQVISGEDLPIEMLPDCEIDSFGDSGINMFVEFWMEGIDDGKNRVGGDLLLIILESIRENGYEIPFPQRDVRIVRSD